MGAGLHESAETSTGLSAILADVDDALHLGMVEEEPVDGTVAAVYEPRGEAAEI